MESLSSSPKRQNISRTSFADSENSYMISRGKPNSAMTDSSIPATRGSSHSALSESSVESLSNTLRSAEGESQGREFFTVSRESIGLGGGASYSLTNRNKSREDKKYINPRAQSPSDPPDPLQRYRAACWHAFNKFSHIMGDAPMDQCEMGLPFDNLLVAVRNISDNNVDMLRSFDDLVHSFQFKEGHTIPWGEFREFADQLFLFQGDESAQSMASTSESGNLGYDLENDSEVDIPVNQLSHSRRKDVASPYSQLVRKNRNATSIYGNEFGDQSSLSINAGSISDIMGTYKLPDNIMAKALTKSIRKFRDAAHVSAGDSIFSTFSQLTYNNSKLPEKKIIPQEQDSVVPCQRTVRASCSGGIKQRDFDISYQGQYKVVTERQKIRDEPFESTLRSISPEMVERLENDDYVKKYNERGDSRLYRVKYDAEDERKETPISYDEVPGKRKLLDSESFTVSMAPALSESVITGTQNERFKNSLDKSKVVEILNPKENYMHKWFVMKEKRDMRRFHEKFKKEQHNITKIVQNTLYMKQKSDMKQMGNLTDEVRQRQINKQKKINYERRQQLDESLKVMKNNQVSRRKELKLNMKSALHSSINQTKKQLEVEKLYKKMSKHPPVHNIVPYSSSKVDIPAKYNEAVANAKNERQFVAAIEKRRQFVEKSMDSRIHQFTENKRQNLLKVRSVDGTGSGVISNYPLRGEDLFESSEIEPSIVMLSPLNSRSERKVNQLQYTLGNDEDAMLMDYDRYLKSAPKALQDLQLESKDATVRTPFVDSPMSNLSRKTFSSGESFKGVDDRSHEELLLGSPTT